MAINFCNTSILVVAIAYQSKNIRIYRLQRLCQSGPNRFHSLAVLIIGLRYQVFTCAIEGLCQLVLLMVKANVTDIHRQGVVSCRSFSWMLKCQKFNSLEIGLIVVRSYHFYLRSYLVMYLRGLMFWLKTLTNRSNLCLHTFPRSVSLLSNLMPPKSQKLVRKLFRIPRI